MHIDANNVATHYNANPHYEWARLERHRTEFAVTQQILTDYLPPAPANIIDIGGGPGQEAKRVLKPGGLLYAAFLNRFALLRYWARAEPTWLLKFQNAVDTLLSTGLAPLPEDNFAKVAYWAHPSEIESLMLDCGLLPLDLINCEGVVADVEEKVNALVGEAWNAWVALNVRLCRERELRGEAVHLLYVGRKPL